MYTLRRWSIVITLIESTSEPCIQFQMTFADIVKMSPLLYGRCCACVSTYVRCTNVPTRGKIGIVWFEKWFYNWSVWWFCLYSLHVAMVFKFLILIISALLYTVYLLYIHNLCLCFEKSSNIDMLTHQLLLE